MSNAVVRRVRKSPAGTDKYGDPETGTETTILLEGCAVAPRESDEISNRGRQGVIVGLTLYAPHGTDLVHTDHLDVDGVRYEIEGDPGQWKSPLSGWEAGMVVALRRATG